MNPYDVLGLEKDAELKQIKSVYRMLSAKHHPDKEGGSREKFEEIKLAYDILSNPDRRARYDKTGRIDESRITPERIKLFIEQTVRQVVDAVRADGSSDDPVWDNIKDKILMSIASSRIPLQQQRFQLQRKLERAERLIERFKPKQEFDPVGDALRAEKKRLQDELNYNEDAEELSREAEKVFKSYDYEVGPGPEGHFSPGPTRRSRGPLFISSEHPTFR